MTSQSMKYLKVSGRKSKVPNWVGVAKWMASFWSSPPLQMLFFPSQPLQKMMCTSSVYQVKSACQPNFSFLICLLCTSGLTDKERSRDGGGAAILLQSDNTFPFPDLNPHLFPSTWSLALYCFCQLQISESRDALTQVGGLSWLRKPSQLLMSLRSALLASGVLVRLRLLRCDDLSIDFVLGSL